MAVLHQVIRKAGPEEDRAILAPGALLMTNIAK